MAGDENISMQEAEGGGGATRGVKKKKKLKRCKQKGRGLRQRLAMASADLRLAADEASVSGAERCEGEGSESVLLTRLRDGPSPSCW